MRPLGRWSVIPLPLPQPYNPRLDLITLRIHSRPHVSVLAWGTPPSPLPHYDLTIPVDSQATTGRICLVMLVGDWEVEAVGVT